MSIDEDLQTVWHAVVTALDTEKLSEDQRQALHAAEAKWVICDTISVDVPSTETREIMRDLADLIKAELYRIAGGHVHLNVHVRPPEPAPPEDWLSLAAGKFREAQD